MEKVRKEFRDSLRERFDKWIEVLDEDATQEDIDEAKKEFDEEVKQHQNQEYTVIEKDALPYAEMLKTWNEQCNNWENGEWKGVIVFDRVISEIIEKLKANPEGGLVVDYATVMYLYKVMSSPKGRGLEAARQMAKFENYDFEKEEIAENDNFVTYSHILQEILVIVKDMTNIDKKLKLMRERINIMTAGVKFNWKITELEEFIQFHEAWICSDIPDNDKELAKMAR